MTFKFPETGFVFWPVGNGDSTTVSVDGQARLQIDINHLDSSDDDDSSASPVIDELEKLLPKHHGRPYLPAFALTHPDEDHCRGFARLIDEVEIGEIWCTTRVLGESEEDLCDDAVEFRKEAERRLTASIDSNGDPGSGNRIRIIGGSAFLEDKFGGCSEDYISGPEAQISVIDGMDLAGKFSALVHAPFPEDEDSDDRNLTSIGLQITLADATGQLQGLLLGDLSFPVVDRILEERAKSEVAWNVFQAPHHCSKSVMYWAEGDEEEQLKPEITGRLGDAALGPNRIVSSSNPVPESNEPGDNPPHAKAKTQYEAITESFLCTMDNEEPIVARLEAGAIEFVGAAAAATSASESASKASGGRAVPASPVTYG